MARGYDLYPGSGAADELISANALTPIAQLPQQLYQNILASRKMALAEEEAYRRETQRKFLREEVDKQDVLNAFAASAPSTGTGKAGTTTTKGKAAAAAVGDKPATYVDPETGKTVIGKRGIEGTRPSDILESSYLRPRSELYEEERDLAAIKKTLGEYDAAKRAYVRPEPVQGQASPQEVIGGLAPTPTSPSSTLGDFAVEPGWRGSTTRPMEEYTTSAVPEDVVRSTLRSKRPWGKALGPGEQAATMRKPASAIDVPMPSRGRDLALENVMEDPLAPYLPEGVGGPRGDMARAGRMLASRRLSHKMGIPYLGDDAMEVLLKYDEYAEHLASKNQDQAATEAVRVRDAVAKQTMEDKAEFVDDTTSMLMDTYGYSREDSNVIAEKLFDKDPTVEDILGHRKEQVLERIKLGPKWAGVSDRRRAYAKLYEGGIQAGMEKATGLLEDGIEASAAGLRTVVESKRTALTVEQNILDTTLDEIGERLGVPPEELERAVRSGTGIQGPYDIPLEANVQNELAKIGLLLGKVDEAKGAFRTAYVDAGSWQDESVDIRNGDDTTGKTYNVLVQYPDGSSEAVPGKPSVMSGRRDLSPSLKTLPGQFRVFANTMTAVRGNSAMKAAPALLGKAPYQPGGTSKYGPTSEVDLDRLAVMAVANGTLLEENAEAWKESFVEKPVEQQYQEAKSIEAERGRQVRKEMGSRGNPGIQPLNRAAALALGAINPMLGGAASAALTGSQIRGAAGGETAPPPTADVIVVSTQEDFDALAPGAHYRQEVDGLGGEVYRK